jgi:hypothetical protein
LTLKSYLLIGMTLAVSASATNLFVNSDFETGNLNGWTVANSGGGDDTFNINNGTSTVASGNPTVGAADGTYYAVSDTSSLASPETTVIYQTVVIPGGMDISLSLDLFVNDVSGAFGSSGLGGEVGIWAGGANPATDAPVVVLGPYDTFGSQGVPNPYVFLSADITADVTAGTTYEIGVLESDLGPPINVGVDDFTLTATPEPGTWLLTGAAMAGLLCFRRFRS